MTFYSDVGDFNDQLYRIQSASAVFQKGIYHVFSLKTIEPVDVAALVNHTVFEDQNAKNAWNGFDSSHPFYECGKSSLAALRRTVDARHNLIYRPFMLDNLFWQDCKLIEHIKQAPHIEEIEQIYIKFSKDVLKQYNIEQDERERRPPPRIPSDVNNVASYPLLWADLFLQNVSGCLNKESP